jgi:uncharacterized membrane protein YkoI
MRTIIQILLISITLSYASVANAKSTNNSDGTSASSQFEAAQVARQHFGGKVLKVQLDSRKSPAKYRVKLLTEDGTVKVVTIMASPKKEK